MGVDFGFVVGFVFFQENFFEFFDFEGDLVVAGLDVGCCG